MGVGRGHGVGGAWLGRWSFGGCRRRRGPSRSCSWPATRHPPPRPPRHARASRSRDGDGGARRSVRSSLTRRLALCVCVCVCVCVSVSVCVCVSFLAGGRQSLRNSLLRYLEALDLRRAQASHGHVTVMSRSCHGYVTFMSRSCHDHFTVTVMSRSFHDHFMVISHSLPECFAVLSRACHDHVSRSRYGHTMVGQGPGTEGPAH